MQEKEIRCPFCSEIVKPEDIKLGYHRSECDKEFPEDFIEKYKKGNAENSSSSLTVEKVNSLTDRELQRRNNVLALHFHILKSVLILY